jgi:hypothetical protein
LEGWNYHRNLRSEKMKRIKINDAFFIETDADTKEYEAKYEIEEIPKNPDDYKPDGSDRPETIQKKLAEESQKKEQDRINETVNRPNLLQSLKQMPHNYSTEAEREAMSFEELVEYHSNVMHLPHIIREAKELGIKNAESKIRQPLLDEIAEKKKVD